MFSKLGHYQNCTQQNSQGTSRIALGFDNCKQIEGLKTIARHTVNRIAMMQHKHTVVALILWNFLSIETHNLILSNLWPSCF